HGVGRDVLRVDDLGGAQALLELGDPLLEHHLLVLRVVVLGVLRDVAELARLLDALGHLATAGGLQLLKLFPEPLQAFRGEDDVSCHGLVDRSPPTENPAFSGDSRRFGGQCERGSIAPGYAALGRSLSAARTALASSNEAVCWSA